MNFKVKEEVSEAAAVFDSAGTSRLDLNDFPLENQSSSGSSDSSESDDSIMSEAKSELNRKRGSDGHDVDSVSSKKRREYLKSLIPPGFLTRKSVDDLNGVTPLPVMPISFVAPEPTAAPEAESEPLPSGMNENGDLSSNQKVPVVRSCKQFWRAGDYEAANSDNCTNFGGMDHLRVHPRFLHSNATSHKWALGAFAELLDNSLDEVCNGATYVHVDMMINKKDGSKMILVEDNGGGMTPDKMRQCMSLGYSAKRKMVNTIGQYGNGFKTSTMRLGADVIVLSRCQGQDGKSSTQSIGMLSYTFLRETGKEDIVVPIVDYERNGKSWNYLQRSSLGDFNKNLETIVKWSPFSNKEDLLKQFNSLENQGTRIIIYNLWEDDEGNLELDFDSDSHDIQIRGVRDEKNIFMANKYPNSRHFLTYRHSLRNYASILYLRLPPGFRIILRGKDIEHHNLVNDMIMPKELTYKPKHLQEGIANDLNMVATVTIGFVKDAHNHIDVQGFNVYHKNRLIKPFWRVWNAAGSDGRGAIGVLEANFVEPAHDKQGFERTPVLSRLEARLVAIQKDYWSANCHEIGYHPRRQTKNTATPKAQLKPSEKGQHAELKLNQDASGSSSSETKSSDDIHIVSPIKKAFPGLDDFKISKRPRSKPAVVNEDGNVNGEGLVKLREKQEPLGGLTEYNPAHLSTELENERTRSRSLEFQLAEAREELQKAKLRIEEVEKEKMALLDILDEERKQREAEHEKSSRRLMEASETMAVLSDKVNALESRGNQ